MGNLPWFTDQGPEARQELKPLEWTHLGFHGIKNISAKCTRFSHEFVWGEGSGFVFSFDQSIFRSRYLIT